MSNPRTFKLPSKKGEAVMHGTDIHEWQEDVKTLFKKVGIDCPIKIDGVYGQATRSFTASLCEAYGLVSKTAMAKGVTPELRIKLRNKDLNKTEKIRFDSKARKEYRAKLRKNWTKKKVHPPVSHIIADSWGFHPGVHDGVDVIANEGVPAFAMVKSKIIDARPHGWWGLGAPANRTLRERGDGIVQMEVLESVGPFKKGEHIGFGHCVHPRVKVGQVVEAGEIVALVGFANAGHIHLMRNNGSTIRGIGNMDPIPLINYAVKNG